MIHNIIEDTTSVARDLASLPLIFHSCVDEHERVLLIVELLGDDCGVVRLGTGRGQVGFRSCCRKILISGNEQALLEGPSHVLEHCLYLKVLHVLGHHGHPADGDGEEVLNTGQDMCGHHERSRRKKIYLL